MYLKSDERGVAPRLLAASMWVLLMRFMPESIVCTPNAKNESNKQ